MTETAYLRGLEEGQITFDLDDSDESFWQDLYIVIAVMVPLVFLIVIRECCRRLNGGNSRQERQIDNDHAMAQQLQSQLDQEARENNNLEEKRKFRREWYESFIKSYTMTIKKTDFFYARDSEEVKETNSTTNSIECPRGSSDDGGEDNVSKNFQQCVMCEEDDNNVASLHLRLPVEGPDGNFRSVDAHCAVCFCEYEEGDQVVWSGLSCKHAFHYDCIMQWLIKGKKRCPICRDWFVPGSRIEDQKKQLELAEQLKRDSTLDSSTGKDSITLSSGSVSSDNSVDGESSD